MTTFKFIFSFAPKYYNLFPLTLKLGRIQLDEPFFLLSRMKSINKLYHQNKSYAHQRQFLRS